jgi:uncharacterized protein
MKFQPDTLDGVNVISRHEGGPPVRIWVGPAAYGHSLLVPWSGAVVPWHDGGFAGLEPAHFERIAALEPELVIFGSGSRLRFPKPALVRALIERGIGLETMDTGAACRTYNVLVSERRRVLGALLVEPAP